MPLRQVKKGTPDDDHRIVFPDDGIHPARTPAGPDKGEAEGG